jgi:hypothetical protein
VAPTSTRAPPMRTHLPYVCVPPSMRACPPYVCAPWGSFKPLGTHICPLGPHLCPLGLNYTPWGSFMPPRTRNVMKDDFGRKLPSGRSPASAFTPRTRFYPQTGFTVRGHDVASARTREKKNIIIFYFLFF